MKILNSIYQDILNAMPASPPEIGGILGSVDGIVRKWKIDTGRSTGRGCFYSPNVEVLNGIIKQWQGENILFCGIFHTHFFSVETLSDGDVAYINAIFQAMPVCIHELYFPVVVLPEKQLVPYLAARNGRLVEIKNDGLILV